MWRPWTFLLRLFSNSNNHDGDDEPEEFPTEYNRHGVKAKGHRAQQFHRCDSQSKMCLDDIDENIRKLKTLKTRIKSRNGKVRHECEEES